MTEEYRPIRDYAIIGDGRSAALVASNGSVDWCCWPRFDSGAVFCRLLDNKLGGWFRVGPAGGFAATRRYLPDTNILETEFTAAAGHFRVTDLMPLPDGAGDAHGCILRLIEGLSGKSAVEIELKPTFDFAREPTEITVADGGASAHSGKQRLAMACPGPLTFDDAGVCRGSLRVKAGERIWLAVVYQSEIGGAARAAAEAEKGLAQTAEFWRKWSCGSTYQGPYGDLVRRSALALKLLIYAPTGALVAAPTTSMPESIGGWRNWDYRYAWLRDSTLIVDALITLGYYDEALNFFGWLERLDLRSRAAPQIVFTVTGGAELPERELTHLDGYRSSRPVRTGNAASAQEQSDVYGEVLGAAHLCFDRTGREVHPETWSTLCLLADGAASRWRENDRGIWETRGDPQAFLYSKLRCWVAVDRAIRLAEDRRLPGDLARWGQARFDIREAILTSGFNEKVGAFTQAFGSDDLDASALVIPHLGFLPFDDPRVLATTAKIRECLTENGLVRRCPSKRGESGREGAFTLCSFWLVDNLALSGQLDEAHRLFETVARHASDLGLLSEEIDPSNGDLLGNYPQGLTHLGLIRSASILGNAGHKRTVRQATWSDGME